MSARATSRATRGRCRIIGPTPNCIVWAGGELESRGQVAWSDAGLFRQRRESREPRRRGATRGRGNIDEPRGQGRSQEFGTKEIMSPGLARGEAAHVTAFCAKFRAQRERKLKDTGCCC